MYKAFLIPVMVWLTNYDEHDHVLLLLYVCIAARTINHWHFAATLVQVFFGIKGQFSFRFNLISLSSCSIALLIYLSTLCSLFFSPRNLTWCPFHVAFIRPIHSSSSERERGRRPDLFERRMNENKWIVCGIQGKGAGCKKKSSKRVKTRFISRMRVNKLVEQSDPGTMRLESDL